MSNGISSGLGFPSGVNAGALHFKIDEGLYYRYIGGGSSQDPLNWVVFGGSIAGDPDTVGWTSRQDGAVWFNSLLNVVRVWNGMTVVSVGVEAYATIQQNGVSVVSGDIINVVGRDALVDDSGGGVTRIRMNDPTSMSYVKDDFIGGSVALFVGEIGEIGWFGNQSGSGAVEIPTMVIGDVSHPGVKRLATGATINSTAFIHLPSTTPFNIVLVDMMFDMLFIVNLRTSDGNTKVSFGLSTGGVPPALSGIRVEKAFADVNWFAYTGNGVGTTRTSLGAIVAGAWERFRIRRINSTTIGFTRNNGVEAEISTTMLGSATGLGISMHLENDAAAAKNFDIDYVDLLVTEATR